MASTALTKKAAESLSRSNEALKRRLSATREASSTLSPGGLITAAVVGAGLALADGMMDDIAGVDPVVAAAGAVGLYGAMRPSGTMRDAGLAAVAVMGFHVTSSMLGTRPEGPSLRAE